MPLADVDRWEAESSSLYALSFLSSNNQRPQDQLSESENSRILADLAIKLRGGWIHTEEFILSFLVIVEKSVSLSKALGMCLKLC